MLKHLPAMQETQVLPLGQEDPLEKEMATHFSYSCLENSMDKGAWQATVHRVTELDMTEQLTHTHTHTQFQKQMCLNRRIIQGTCLKSDSQFTPLEIPIQCLWGRALETVSWAVNRR